MNVFLLGTILIDSVVVVVVVNIAVVVDDIAVVVDDISTVNVVKADRWHSCFLSVLVCFFNLKKYILVLKLTNVSKLIKNLFSANEQGHLISKFLMAWFRLKVLEVLFCVFVFLIENLKIENSNTLTTTTATEQTMRPEDNFLIN